MGKYEFVASSASVFLLLQILLVSQPTFIQDFTGLNTTALQQNTNVSISDPSINQSTDTSLLDEVNPLSGFTDTLSDVVSVYTNPQTENRFLASLFVLYLILLAVLLTDLILPG